MFLKLNHKPIPDDFDNFQLNIQDLENQITSIDQKYNLFRRPENISTTNEYSFLLKFAVNDDKRNEPTKIDRSITTPISKIYANKQELLSDMLILYQMNYFNYLMAKKQGMNNGDFPHNCCGVSSRNIVLSGNEFEMKNLAYARSSIIPHDYVIAPFQIPSEKIKGTIIIDPTSDQFNYIHEKRNKVMLKKGVCFEYELHGLEDINLFPDKVLGMHQFQYYPENLIEMKSSFNGFDFLKQAHENPKEIKYNVN